MMRYVLGCLLLLLAGNPAGGFGGEVLLDRPFGAEADFKDAYQRIPAQAKIVSLDEGGMAAEFTVPDDPGVKAESKVAFQLNGEKIRGRKLTFSGEVRILQATETARWGGAEFSMWFPYIKGKPGYGYDQVAIGTRTDGWKKLSKEVAVPDYATHLLFTVGLNNARGTVQFRNLRVEAAAETADKLINFPQAANMGFKDEVAGDLKGGWHDAGANYDASRFPVSNQLFGNVPFSVLNPQANHGKAILVFACPKLPGGVQEAAVEVNAAGKYLYLLHASAWSQPAQTKIGSITLENAAGKTAMIEVIFGKDAQEWFGARPAENAWIGAQFPSGGSIGAAYVSRFAIPEGFGVVSRMTLRHDPQATAMWMVLAANISGVLYQQPQQRSLSIQEDEVWKPLPQSVVQAPKAGTALDFSALFPAEPAGAHGRVVVTGDGHFAYEDAPGKPVRFMAVNSGRDFDSYFGFLPNECPSKECITQYVEQMRRNGYNMIRWWVQSRNSKLKAFATDPDREDRQDWLYAELKRNGIYLILSIDDWSAGYDNCGLWTDDARRKNHSVYLHPEHRQNWLKWATLQLTHVNPYTKTSLLEDPVLAGIDCGNELEFFFLRADDRCAPLWRDFLQQKYKDIGALKAAWGKDADGLAAFADIKTFKPLGEEYKGALQQDKAEFVTGQERGLLEWQKAELVKLGFKGFVTNFCMSRTMRHVGIRRAADFVMQNGYHAHPLSGSTTEGGRTPQDSSVGAAVNIIRTFLSSRMFAKPYVVSEHGHVFWNKYRYEQGLVMGAYSALNDLDGLTAFFMQVTTQPNAPLTAFEIRHDPISRASELQTALLFRRADAAAAPCRFRVKLDPEQAIRNGEVTESINAAQMKLGLLGAVAVDVTELPAKQGDVILNRVGGSRTAVRSADTNIIDTPNSGFDFDKILAQLKENKTVPAANRTSSEKGIYESINGEIFLDSSRNFLKVDTARTQGIAAEAGTQATLPVFSVMGMNRRGSISLSAIDGAKPLAEANRLLLIVATNVLNTGMAFTDVDQVERISNGKTPLLLETGTFSLRVTSPQVDGMKLYALALDGTRISEIPMVVKNGKADILLETAKYPTVYFELSKQ